MCSLVHAQVPEAVGLVPPVELAFVLCHQHEQRHPREKLYQRGIIYTS